MRNVMTNVLEAKSLCTSMLISRWKRVLEKKNGQVNYF